MRAILVLVLSGTLLAGCKHPSSAGPGGPTDTPQKQSGKTAAPRTSSAPVNQATPLNESFGKVASVNAGLRFVVIDFALNPAPRADQRMSVYRAGQKVGEVKVSNQSRNSIVAADIMAGEARVGDEVRPE